MLWRAAGGLHSFVSMNREASAEEGGHGAQGPTGPPESMRASPYRNKTFRDAAKPFPLSSTK